MSSCSTIRRALLTALVLCLAPRAIGQTAPSEPLRIPRLSRAPTFEDFLDMRPPADLAREMTMVTDFLQRQPSDGQPASERTEVYLGYDDLNLYAVFVCFDSEPDRIRARLSPRGDSGNDDWIVIVLDTFRDQRNAYMFGTTPLGVEWDALFTEGQGADANYDTLYDSSAGLTDSGYVVWLAMPFKSLRFPAESQQTWGMQFGRSIPRLNEQSFWPSYSTRIEGRLNQAAPATGLENVSPGRNVQLLPFTGFRSFRAIDRRNPARPAFQTDPARFDAGLDAKLVFRDSLVTDVTVNPDFSQVESDEPQVTANERFEVLFPEKRPFFLENAGFFQTPINLVFTRRIADPQFGARLTGKLGRYSIGALVADDQSPGKRAPDGDPRQGRRARFSIVRVNRDIFDQSTVGAIVTERAFDGAFNRVAGADARIKLDDNWVTQLQAVASTTRFADGSRQSGPAYEILLNRAGRQFNFDLAYSDRGAGFLTQTGFNPRNDIRNLTANVEYAFRPEGDRFIAMTPAVTVTRVMARDGTRLEEAVAPQVTWEFSGQTFVNVFLLPERLRLRPSEAAVSAPRDFRRNVFGAAIESAVIASVEFAVRYQRGGQKPGRGPGSVAGRLVHRGRERGPPAGPAPDHRQPLSLHAAGPPGNRSGDLQRSHPADALELAVHARVLGAGHPPVRGAAGQSRVDEPGDTEELQRGLPGGLSAQRMDGVLRRLQQQRPEHRPGLDGGRRPHRPDAERLHTGRTPVLRQVLLPGPVLRRIPAFAAFAIHWKQPAVGEAARAFDSRNAKE